MIARTVTGQLDLLGYVAPEPALASDQTDGILGFMQAMASIGQQPTMRDVAQYLGTDGVIDDATAAAWRDLVAAGRIVGFEVPEELGALHWRLLPGADAGRDVKPEIPPEPLVNRPLLLLLDANNLLHRLYHAPAREPVAERWGWSLNRWRRAVNPDFAIAVFDGEGPTWRHDIYPPYKAKRDDHPSKRPSATDWRDARLECDAARLRWVQVSGVEADDLIASYVAAALRIHVDVAIVSSDKDLWQLIRDEPIRVQSIDPGNGSTKGHTDALARWGVEPRLLADVLALAGDASDNYPGVRGIGPKVAGRLVAEHGDVEAILDRVNLLPARLSEKLRAQAAEARLFRKLAGLADDLPLPIPITFADWASKP